MLLIVFFGFLFFLFCVCVCPLSSVIVRCRWLCGVVVYCCLRVFVVVRYWLYVVRCLLLVVYCLLLIVVV